MKCCIIRPFSSWSFIFVEWNIKHSMTHVKQWKRSPMISYADNWEKLGNNNKHSYINILFNVFKIFAEILKPMIILLFSIIFQYILSIKRYSLTIKIRKLYHFIERLLFCWKSKKKWLQWPFDSRLNWW